MSLPDPVGNSVSAIKIIVGAVVGVIIIGIVGYLAYTKSLLETQVANDALTISQYEIANTNWAEQSAKASKAIADLKADAASRAAEAERRVEAARNEAQSYLNRANTIAASKPAGDDCTAAKNLANAYFGGHP